MHANHQTAAMSHTISGIQTKKNKIPLVNSKLPKFNTYFETYS